MCHSVRVKICEALNQIMTVPDKPGMKLCTSSVEGEFHNRKQFREDQPIPITGADSPNQGDNVGGLRLDITEILENS
jgi:hypothetical protein